MGDNYKKDLITFLEYLSEKQFEEWVNSAKIEDIDIALEHYEEKQHQRVEAELKKYEAQAISIIKKAMRK
jgi:hypothetical protein